MDFGFDLIHSLAGISKLIDWAIIFCGQFLPYLVVIALAIGILAQRPWRRRLTIFFFAGLSLLVARGIIQTLINYFFPVDRPFVARVFEPLISLPPLPSFPSGHSVIFFALATVVFLQMSSRWGIVMYLFAIIIGAARVSAGLHYPIDIIGGAVIGMLVPLALRVLLPTLSVKPGDDNAEGVDLKNIENA
jgi:undecaprenyl-diphosphatase